MIAPTQQALGARPTSAATLTRHCIAYEVPFRLQAADHDSLSAMVDVLPFGTNMIPCGRLDATCFSLPTKTHPHFPTLLARLEQQLLLHVAMHAPHRTFLHAGVVAWGGRAILLPGPSHAGKSTLVAELIKLGAVYYSDEYAVLDSSGLVHPFPRGLRLRVPGCSHQTQVSPEALSGKVGHAPAVVARVVLTNFVPDAGWNPQPLTAGMAVLAMLPHCVSARRHPSVALTTLKALMQTAQGCRTVRGDAAATAHLLLQTVAPGPTPA